MVAMQTSTSALDFFAAKLAYETDPSDVHAARQRGEDLIVVDSRGEASWRQGRVMGAVHLPTAEIVQRAAELLPAGSEVVVYCWGPGCDGSTRAALALSGLGYSVKEMIGGFEYWAREGLPVETDDGISARRPDPLTAPVSALTCDC